MFRVLGVLMFGLSRVLGVLMFGLSLATAAIYFFLVNPQQQTTILSQTNCPTLCARSTFPEFTKNSKQVEKIINKLMSSSPLDPTVSILDLPSGALSYKQTFINIYKLDTETLLTKYQVEILKTLYTDIQATISKTFNLTQKIWLATPSFFSRIKGGKGYEISNLHDEYWHEHIDKEQYGSFAYTALVYLSDYSKDFEGGEFVFVDELDKDTRIETMVYPKSGLLSMFSSGSENKHLVRKVTNGVRFAMTVAFTFDEKFKADLSFLDKLVKE